MEFETEKPTHCGFAQLGNPAKHPVPPDSLVAADRQGRRIHERDAGLLAITGLISQVELARRAGIRPETLNWLEQGKHSPSIATVDKLDRALSRAERERP